MTTQSSLRATLLRWQQPGSGASRQEVEAVLLELGYQPHPPADYPLLATLYYREGVPGRIILQNDWDDVPESVLSRIAATLLKLLDSEEFK